MLEETGTKWSISTGKRVLYRKGLASQRTHPNREAQHHVGGALLQEGLVHH
jgi:hypothetical protein